MHSHSLICHALCAFISRYKHKDDTQDTPTNKQHAHSRAVWKCASCDEKKCASELTHATQGDVAEDADDEDNAAHHVSTAPRMKEKRIRSKSYIVANVGV